LEGQGFLKNITSFGLKLEIKKNIVWRLRLKKTSTKIDMKLIHFAQVYKTCPVFTLL